MKILSKMRTSVVSLLQRKEEEVEPLRSYADRESLTEWEIGQVGSGRCPDCEHEGLLAGPRGGMAQNFKCANSGCGSRFNDMGPFGIDRISDPSPDKPPGDGNGGAYR